MKTSRKHPPDWLLAILLIAGVYLWQRTVFPIWMVDILPLHVASWQWKHDQSDWMYATQENSGEWFPRAKAVSDSLGGEGFSNPYYYAPLIAAMLSPFSDMHAKVWMYALFVLNTSLIFAFAVIILKISGTAFRFRNFLWATALPLLAYPLSRATKLGQVVPIIIIMVWLGILADQRKRDKLSGATIGFAGAIKLFPLGLLAIPAMVRKWKAVLASFAVVAGFYLLSIFTLGWEIHLKWWKSIQEFGGLVNTYQGNQSLTGWYSRVFGERDLVEFVSPPNPELELVHLVTAVLIAGITLSVLWLNRRHVTPETLPLHYGLVLAGILLAIANAWEHYWLFCLPVLVFPLRDAWQRGKLNFHAVWVLGMSFFFLMKLTRFYDESMLGRILSGTQTIGLIMLWFWLIWKIHFRNIDFQNLAIHGRS